MGSGSHRQLSARQPTADAGSACRRQLGLPHRSAVCRIAPAMAAASSEIGTPTCVSSASWFVRWATRGKVRVTVGGCPCGVAALGPCSSRVRSDFAERAAPRALDPRHPQRRGAGASQSTRRYCRSEPSPRPWHDGASGCRQGDAPGSRATRPGAVPTTPRRSDLTTGSPSTAGASTRSPPRTSAENTSETSSNEPSRESCKRSAQMHSPTRSAPRCATSQDDPTTASSASVVTWTSLRARPR